MIQIKRTNLDELANIHCSNLKLLLIKRIKEERGELYDFLETNLVDILAGRPEILTQIIRDIPPITGKEKSLSAIFNYTGFIKTYDPHKYGAYSLAENLKVNVCPYCNRQYTFTYRNTKKPSGKTRPEFDHFFSKATYPYLALSFYNLIPCCHVCNSSFKNTIPFTLENNIHPYLEGFEDDVKFKIVLKDKRKFKPEDVKNWYGVNFFSGASESFEIKIFLQEEKSEKEKRANKNITVFHLDDLYNGHKDYIIELVQKAEIYNSDYVESIFQEYEGKLFTTIGEVYQMLLSNYIHPDDFEKRTLSKLTRDISEELGILY